MNKKRRAKKKKKVDLGQVNKEDNSWLSSSIFVPLKPPEGTYFLGFKRKNFNELWDWRTLEDVNFK